MQVKYIHGLPVIRYRKMNYYTENEVLHELVKIFSSKDTFVACKGGDIERYVLDYLRVKSINLEVFDCAKYDKLLLRFNLETKFCNEHTILTHCSRYEVIVFGFFILDELDILKSNKDAFLSLYNKA